MQLPGLALSRAPRISLCATCGMPQLGFTGSAEGAEWPHQRCVSVTSVAFSSDGTYVGVGYYISK